MKFLETKKAEKVVVKNKKTDELRTIEIDGVFIAVGMTPQTEIYKNSGIEMNEKGYIVAGENCKTNIPGVYVAGDVRTKRAKTNYNCLCRWSSCCLKYWKIPNRNKILIKVLTEIRIGKDF